VFRYKCFVYGAVKIDENYSVTKVTINKLQRFVVACSVFKYFIYGLYNNPRLYTVSNDRIFQEDECENV
jgi:hypothetical protein